MRLKCLFVVAALGLTAGRAYAQDFHSSPYSESVYNEGPGFRLGSAPLVLHPGLAAEFGYDSNVFYNPVATGSGLMRLRAHLDLATLPPEAFANDNSKSEQKIEFRFSTQVEYREYLTSDPTVQQQRSINLYGSAHLTILPAGPFTLKLGDDFVRTVDPRNYETTANFTRDYNRASIIGSYHTSGDTFEIGLGDSFTLNYWENGLNFADNFNDEGQLFAKWRFLPRSVLSALFRVGYVDYRNQNVLNSIPFRGVLGFSSLFSTWFGFSVTAGYGNSFNQTGPSYNNFVGGAEVRFILPYRQTISLIYDRDFYDTLFANYFVDDHVGLNYILPLTDRIAARLEGGIRFRHYDGLAPAATFNAVGYSSTTRDDTIYTLRAEVTVRATKWLAFSANYNLIADPTTFAFLEAGNGIQHVDYIKHSVFGRIDIAY